MEASQNRCGRHCAAPHGKAIGTVGGSADFTDYLTRALKCLPNKLKDVRFSSRVFSFDKGAVQSGIG